MQKQIYKPEIDGLRAVAVVFVVIYHAFPTALSGGFIGVDVFFVISGFLITNLLLENIVNKTFTFREFYQRRIVRLFPALAIVLLSTLAFGKLLLFPDEQIQIGKNAMAGTLFVANFLSWSEAGYFDSASITKPLLHLWSLGVEEQFYIIWPLLLWFARKSMKKIFLAMLIIALISFVLNVITVGTYSTAAFYSPLTRVWELASGAVLSQVINRRKLRKSTINLLDQQAVSSNGLISNIMKSKSIRNIFGAFGLLMILWGAFSIESEKAFPGTWALIPVFGSILIIIATKGESFLQLVLGSRFLVAVGLISYPLYLWHWPILVYARMIFGKDILTIHLIFAIFVSTLFAWLTFVFVEKPLKRINLNLSKKATILSLVMVLTLIVGMQFYRAIPSENLISADPKQTNQPPLIKTNSIEDGRPIIEREGTASPLDSSLRWFRGRDNWLYLGNTYDQTIDKLTLKIVPTQDTLETTAFAFDRLASTADIFGTRVALLIAPSKPSVYSEYLPSQVVVSKKRYINFFTERLGEIQNLLVLEPTQDLIESKNKEGLVYYRTDTHWNVKGAYVAYKQLLKKLGIPVPKVHFKAAPAIQGDLIEISGLKGFPVQVGDNWEVIWNGGKNWRVEVNTKGRLFNDSITSTNDKAPSNINVWVIGDSFAVALNPFIFSTFKSVSYIGHWHENIGSLPEKLREAEVKPDLIIVIRAERQF